VVIAAVYRISGLGLAADSMDAKSMAQQLQRDGQSSGEDSRTTRYVSTSSQAVIDAGIIDATGSWYDPGGHNSWAILTYVPHGMYDQLTFEVDYQLAKGLSVQLATTPNVQTNGSDLHASWPLQRTSWFDQLIAPNRDVVVDWGNSQAAAQPGSTTASSSQFESYPQVGVGIVDDSDSTRNMLAQDVHTNTFGQSQLRRYGLAEATAIAQLQM